jgi:hypothetical protein
MHIAGWRGLLGQALVILAISACSLAGCAPLIGYPKDPENTDATLAALAPYFNGVKEADYLATADLALRTAKRNAIVLARLRGYDIEFYDFEQELYGQGNEITLGADLSLSARAVPWSAPCARAHRTHQHGGDILRRSAQLADYSKNIIGRPAIRLGLSGIVCGLSAQFCARSRDVFLPALRA